MPSLPTSLTVRRSLRRGWRSFARTGLSRPLLTLAIGCMVALQIVLLSAIGLQVGGQILRSQSDLRLEINRNATGTEVQQLAAALRELPAVENVRTVTREEALALAKANDPELVTFIEKFGLQNPFPDTLVVRVASIDVSSDVVQFVQASQWQRVLDPAFALQATEREAQARETLGVLNIVRLIGAILLAAAAFGLLVVLASFILRRMQDKADELRLVRLLGARPFDVLFPFGFEMTLLFFVGLLASILILALLITASALIGGSLFAVPFLQQLFWKVLLWSPVLILAEIVVLPLFVWAAASVRVLGGSR